MMMMMMIIWRSFLRNGWRYSHSCYRMRTIPKFSNGAISNDLEWCLTRISVLAVSKQCTSMSNGHNNCYSICRALRQCRALKKGRKGLEGMRRGIRSGICVSDQLSLAEVVAVANDDLIFQVMCSDRHVLNCLLPVKTERTT